jgi:hypothetical protein
MTDLVANVGTVSLLVLGLVLIRVVGDIVKHYRHPMHPPPE